MSVSGGRRILVVTGGLNVGGSQAMAAQLAIGLHRTARWNVVVANLGREGPGSEALARAGVPEYRPFRGRLGRRGPSALQRLVGLLRFWGFLTRGNFDLVNAHLVGSALAVFPSLLNRRTRVVVTFHGDVPGSRRRLIPPIVRIADATVAVSQTVREFVVDACGGRGVPPRVVFNGIPRSVDALGKESAAASATGLVVGCVGHLASFKGQTLLLHAFSRIAWGEDGATLVIVGDGPDQKRLESLASQLGVEDRVIFTGQVAEARSLIRSFDVLVVPSVRDGFNLTVLEAMAVHVPVIVSRSGGPEEIVEDGISGRVVDAGSVPALEAALKEFMTGRGASWVEAGFERFENHFTEDRMLLGYEDLYRELLSHDRQRRGD